MEAYAQVAGTPLGGSTPPIDLSVYGLFLQADWVVKAVMIALLLVVIAATIAITQAQRRIAVQYAKRVVGRKQFGGQTQYLPLKVNYAGVMPIIFGSAIRAAGDTVFSMLVTFACAWGLMVLPTYLTWRKSTPVQCDSLSNV